MTREFRREMHFSAFWKLAEKYFFVGMKSLGTLRRVYWEWLYANSSSWCSLEATHFYFIHGFFLTYSFVYLFIFQIQLLLLLLKYFLWSDIWNVSYIELRIWNVQTSLKSWLFQASVRNCLNCVHNCDDHGLLETFLLGLFCPRLEWEYLWPTLLGVLMAVLMVFHKILVSAKSMSFHSFSQNPKLSATFLLKIWKS